MVRPTNVHSGGGESRGGMKDEVLSSILSDGTTVNGEGPRGPLFCLLGQHQVILNNAY